MRIIEHTEFDDYVENFCSRKKNFIVETKRTTNTMYIDSGVAFMSKGAKKSVAHKDNRKSVVSLFAQVQKSVNKHIVDTKFKIKAVKPNHPSTKSNKSRWNALNIGDKFYYVDVKHCYWRIAYLQGLISEKLYTKTLEKPELKIERNMSLAMIIAPKKRKYYVDGEMILEVQEEKKIFRTVYDNIRFTAYNLMGDCMKLGGTSFIGYRTDGIMLTEEAVNDVAELITEKGFDYSIKECTKINSRQYRNEKGKEVNF
jgi:hypothetical protein